MVSYGRHYRCRGTGSVDQGAAAWQRSQGRTPHIQAADPRPGAASCGESRSLASSAREAAAIAGRDKAVRLVAGQAVSATAQGLPTVLPASDQVRNRCDEPATDRQVTESR